MNPDLEDIKLGISKVEVDELFGHLSYTIDSPSAQPGPDTSSSRVLFLYGDNGSGKTTIMNMIFRALSPHGHQGHRTFLANIPFKSFRVTLTDDSIIELRRPQCSVGSYEYAIRLASNVWNFGIEVDEDLRVPQDLPRIDELTDILSSLPLNIYFLSDDRRFREDFLQVSEGMQSRLGRYEDSRSYSYGDLNEVIDAIRVEQVGDALKKSARWIRDQLLSASDVGQTSAEALYREVVKQLTSLFPAQSQDIAITQPELVVQLRDLRASGAALESLGLRSASVSNELIDAVAECPSDRFNGVLAVLDPFVVGLSTRQNAIEPIRRVVATFLHTLNSFFVNKAVHFDVRNGLSITSIPMSQILDPTALSSGERQLLLIFCNAIHAREDASVFMIDEPELSLNVKWQRRLVDGLLACTHRSPVQFIFATHSLAILAGRRENVAQLKSQPGSHERDG